MAAGWFIACRFGRAFALFAGEDFDFAFHFSLQSSTLVPGLPRIVPDPRRRVLRSPPHRSDDDHSGLRNLPEPARPVAAARDSTDRLTAFIVLALLGLAAPWPFPSWSAGSHRARRRAR